MTDVSFCLETETSWEVPGHKLKHCHNCHEWSMIFVSVHPSWTPYCSCFSFLFVFMTYHKLTTDEMLALLIGWKNFPFKTILWFMSIYLMGACLVSTGVCPSWKCWSVVARVRRRRAREDVRSREANNRHTDAQFCFLAFALFEYCNVFLGDDRWRNPHCLLKQV